MAEQPTTIASLQAENERLTALNKRIADLYVGQTQRLEDSARGLMAYGWDACTTHLRDTGMIAEMLRVSTLEENPFSQPVTL